MAFSNPDSESSAAVPEMYQKLEKIQKSTR